MGVVCFQSWLKAGVVPTQTRAVSNKPAGVGGGIADCPGDEKEGLKGGVLQMGGMGCGSLWKGWMGWVR